MRCVFLLFLVAFLPLRAAADPNPIAGSDRLGGAKRPLVGGASFRGLRV